MQKIGKLLVISTLVAATMAVFTKQALADSSSNTNTNNNTVTIDCTNGNYGTQTCESFNTQSIENRVLGMTHTPVNTGMDTTTTAATVIGLVTSTGGAIITWKSRVKVS